MKGLVTWPDCRALMRPRGAPETPALCLPGCPGLICCGEDLAALVELRFLCRQFRGGVGLQTLVGYG